MTNEAPIRQWRRPIQNPILRMILRETDNCADCGVQTMCRAGPSMRGALGNSLPSPFLSFPSPSSLLPPP